MKQLQLKNLGNRTCKNNKAVQGSEFPFLRLLCSFKLQLIPSQNGEKSKLQLWNYFFLMPRHFILFLFITIQTASKLWYEIRRHITSLLRRYILTMCFVCPWPFLWYQYTLIFSVNEITIPKGKTSHQKTLYSFNHQLEGQTAKRRSRYFS